MSISRLRVSGLVLATIAVATLVAVRGYRSTPVPAGTPSASVDQVTAKARAVEGYGKLPVMFEANTGQTDAQVRFVSRQSGFAVFLTPNEAVFKLKMPAVLKGDHPQRPEEEAKGETADAWTNHDEKGGRPKWAGKDDTMVRTGPGRPPWAGSDREFDNQPMSRSAVVRMRLVGANPAPRIAGQERLSGVANYYIGKDPAKWRSEIPLYGRVRYEQVYPGIDMVYYGHQRELEYDLIVAPGRDPKTIGFEFTGARAMEVNEAGDLVLHVGGKQFVQHKPFAYQDVEGARREVAARYVRQGERGIGFEVGTYDTSRTLVIDPKVVWSTFLGGSGNDQALGVAVGANGWVYVTGKTTSTDFPTVDAAQSTNNTGTVFEPGYDETGSDASDIFVSKLNAAGSALIFSTYLGGAKDDRAFGIGLDAEGYAFVAGQTVSDDFPTKHAAQDVFGSISESGTDDDDDEGWFDAFLAKVNDVGVLVFSTYHGGSFQDRAFGIAVMPDGTSCIAGMTDSFDLPVLSAFQAVLRDPDPGQKAVDDNLTPPPDAWVAKYSPTGARIYSTYLGGNAVDVAYAVAIDPAGACYVTGKTASRPREVEIPRGTKRTIPGFPVTVGAYDRSLNTAEIKDDLDPDVRPSSGFCCDVGTDVFVTKLSPNGKTLIYSTFLGAKDADPGAHRSSRGGERTDIGRAIALDQDKRAYVTGGWGGDDDDDGDHPPVGSTLFPNVRASDSTYNGGELDVFVSRLSPAGSDLQYSTYLGGKGEDVGWGIAVIGTTAYVVGTIDTTDGFSFAPAASGFPQKNTIQGVQAGGGNAEDAFVAKFNTSGTGGGSLISSTIIGAPGSDSEDTGRAIAVRGPGEVFIAGSTKNSNFGTTSGAFDRTFNGGSEDAFVMKINDSAFAWSPTFPGQLADGGRRPPQVTTFAAVEMYPAPLQLLRRLLSPSAGLGRASHK